MENQFNLATNEGFNKFFESFTFLKSIGAVVELKVIKQTRSNRQNAALHLFYTWCANALNKNQDWFKYTDYKNVLCEIEWTGEMFKTYWIKPIIKVHYDINSTTKLKTNEIDIIIDVITKRFAENGISINFPSQFSYWLEKVGY
jgi:hypothetical protein